MRLTHSHTGITAHSGTQADGSTWLVAIANNGFELRRMAASVPQQRVAAIGAVPTPAAAATSATGSTELGDARSYAAWRSLYPRSWFPAITGDQGLTAYGASTFGGDALGWHNYAALLMWETSQREPIASLEYLFLGRHHVALTRSLTARASVGSGRSEETTLYDRDTQLQWLSIQPFARLQRSWTFGVGAALDRRERINVSTDTSTRPRDERLAAVLVDYDSAASNWASEGHNHGQRHTLLYETYKPFARSNTTDYDGELLRLDLRGYFGIGRSVLGLKHTEARARGRTEPYQLGGALDPQLQLGTVLNSRRIALRGYDPDEPTLTGTDARVTSIEWRTPLVDVDRHGMVPPIGLNRLSATLFFDIGGAWTQGERPAQYKRGAGVELIGELKLLYSLGLQLRGGVAKGLDEPRDVLGYFSLGRAF